MIKVGQESNVTMPGVPAQAEKCEHRKFTAHCHVEITEDQKDENGNMLYRLEVKVRCSQCGLPFHFVGLPQKMATTEPCVIPTGTEATLPIKPGPAPVQP